MEKIATDIYSFDVLRNEGFLYVDKTAAMRPLVDMSIGKQFFCARPRRFGKSLMVSTLQCLFEGRRELFAGLAIEPEWDWSKKWPVIRLDMGTIQADSPDELKRALNELVRSQGERFGVALDAGLDPASVFRRLIESVAKQSADGRCVVLVDEYDKPLLNHLGEDGVDRFQQVLKPFYGVIKYTEGLQRFAFMTGVSKFSKVSIFLDLNNLNDVTMDPRFPRLFGYTHEEVLKYFGEMLPALAEKNGMSSADVVFERLKNKYDGYCFEEGFPLVFNPVSVGKCFATGQFKDFWFETGTPTFLIELLKRNPINLNHPEVTLGSFSVYEPSKPALLPILVQTGYLTIKAVREEGEDKIYTLDFPNSEVKQAFCESIARGFSEIAEDEPPSLLSQMCEALRKDDVNDMLDALSCFFANVPADITVKREKYYQSLFYAVFVLIGARVQAECWTNRGRVDAVVETANDVYLFEFNLDGTADAALAQISERGYYEKYLRSGKVLSLVGVAFDGGMRNLVDRRIERVEAFAGPKEGGVK